MVSIVSRLFRHSCSGFPDSGFPNFPRIREIHIKVKIGNHGNFDVHNVIQPLLLKLLGMDVSRQVDNVSYDDISNNVRAFVAERLYELERSLRPLVDGSFGEVVPGHLTGYLNTLRDLGRLYQVHERPRDAEAFIPISKVQELLAARDEMWQRQLEEEVHKARMQFDAELHEGRELQVSRAKELVSARLRELEARGVTP